MKHPIVLSLVALLAFSACGTLLQTASMETAVSRGDTTKINEMLSKGYDVNTRGPIIGQTALMLAAYWGKIETVKLLTDRGANVNIRENSGATALMYASFAPQYAAKNGIPTSKYSEVIDLLISKGADVNAKDERGTTALMLAAAQGGREWAERLIDHGADIRAKDINGLPAWVFSALGFCDPERKTRPQIMAKLVSPDLLFPSEVAVVLFPAEPFALWEERPGGDVLVRNIPKRIEVIYSRKENHGKYALGHVTVVRPGELRLKGSYESTIFGGDQITHITGEKVSLSISAKAGHIYAVRYIVGEYSWLPWSEEISIGN